MYSQQIEKLIELALADGELTEKEKQVLLKKADAEGIDMDEFEMVLNAKLYEKNNSKAETLSVSPKSNKNGDVKNCPSCGATVKAFSTSCDDCDFEFRNINVNKSVENLSKQLQEIVVTCERKSYKQTLGSTFHEEIARQDDIITKQKSLIKNFPIPQTREDLLELLHFIYPKTKVGFSSDKNVSAWRDKFSEILNRAKSAYSTDKKMLAEIAQYESQQQISKYNKVLLIFNSLNSKGKLIVGFVAVYILLAAGWGIYEMYGVSEIKMEEKRLNNLESKISQAIQDNKLEDAKILLNQFEWSITEDRKKTFMDDMMKVKDKYQDKRDYWHSKKNNLGILIKEHKTSK